jgi:hypothetical protein
MVLLAMHYQKFSPTTSWQLRSSSVP